MQSPRKPKRSSRMKRRSSMKRRSRSKSMVRIPLTTKGGLYGYHVDMLMKDRRALLKKILRNNWATYSELVKRLNVLAIYNKNRNPELSKRVQMDMHYIQRHEGMKKSITRKTSVRRRSKRKSSVRRRSKRKSPIRRRSRRKSSIRGGAVKRPSMGCSGW